MEKWGLTRSRLDRRSTLLRPARPAFRHGTAPAAGQRLARFRKADVGPPLALGTVRRVAVRLDIRNGKFSAEKLAEDGGALIIGMTQTVVISREAG